MIFWPYGTPDLSDALVAPTRFLDFDHPRVRSFVEETTAGAGNDIDRAVRLYHAVRDGIAYDMYGFSDDPARNTASHVLEKGASWCVPKAVLLAAAARAAGIPAVIGLSDVRNHFTTPKMEALMGRDAVFLDHGYAGLHLGGRWLKVVPAFDAALCAKMGVAPTPFDGRSDALLQEFDARNRTRMTYLKDHGFWSDLPLRRIVDDFAGYYPARLMSPGA